MQSIHQQMRANSLKLQQTQPTDPNYASVVAQVSQANGVAAFADDHAARGHARAQMFKVLTPAQQTQLAALQAQMQSRTHGAWGRMEQARGCRAERNSRICIAGGRRLPKVVGAALRAGWRRSRLF